MNGHKFEVGQQVSWTNVSRRGRMRSMTVCNGYIHDIDEEKQLVRVRRGKNGKKDYYLPFTVVAAKDKPIKKFVSDIAESVRDR